MNTQTNLVMHRAILTCYPLLHPLKHAAALDLALETRYFPRSTPANMKAEDGNVGWIGHPARVGDYLPDEDGRGITKITAIREFWYHRPLLADERRPA